MRLRMKHFLEYLADPEHQQDDSPMYIFDGTFGDRCAALQTATSDQLTSLLSLSVPVMSALLFKVDGLGAIHRHGPNSLSQRGQLLLGT